MQQTKKCSAGFTLIELSIVLAIVALLVGSAVSMGSNAIKAAQRVTTQERMAAVKSALESYIKVNGYLPCPVDRAQTPRDNPTTFGREIRPCAASGALVRVGGNTVDIGAVPVRTLGLPDTYAADAWGNKFTYAASVALETDYTSADAAISIYTGNRSGAYYQVTTNFSGAAGAGAAYVLVSHGPNGRGAYPLRSAFIATGCSAGTGNENDIENCDDNISFWDNIYNDGNLDVNFFDDYILWSGNSLDRASTQTVSTCTTGCESWCAPCAGNPANMPTAGAGAFVSGSAYLCKKIINSSSPCQATCVWAGTVTTSPLVKVKCP